MTDSVTAEKPTKDDSYRAYYDASQFRTDVWNELKQLTAQRERLERASKDTAGVQRKIRRILEVLKEVEAYFCFPGQRAVAQLESLLDRGLFIAQARQTERVVRLLVGDSYRRRDVSEIFHEDFDNVDASGAEIVEHIGASGSRPYCEVLVVDEVGGGGREHQDLRKRMLGMRRDQDEFVYDVVIVGSFEDAVIAALFNHNIQSVVIRYSFPFESTTALPALRDYLSLVDFDALGDKLETIPSWALGETLKALRPEIDRFLVTDDPLRNVAGHTGRAFRRVFYQQEDYLELHLSILRGIYDRYETPFFNALRDYSHRPTGVFHALPISRGNSITKSHWIRDMGVFYGENIFLAETSATTGGLDSLLQPHGPIKRSQEKAARAFGAKSSYFVTNGTSTANKIVVQALMAPNEIALVSRDCHKSHHYAIVLAGSLPVYLDPYPVQPYSMYGAVPLSEIKKQLLALKEEGKLDRVRLLLLTNCTFDGIVYDPFRVMMEVLAIKPDMVFVWDEAWFAFARFSPTYRGRTAMASARRLVHLFASSEYREEYRVAQSKGITDTLPDPDRARVRVYATHSTHKTLTSLRQGSMIHVYDQDFGRLAHEAFEEAYMTHTSTSPNYQILASLDVGRRQVELEGFELVEQSVSLAMTLRERVQESPLLRRYFQVLKLRDLVPVGYRPSGLEEFYGPAAGYRSMGDAWRWDEFTLDPTRVTVHVGTTGMDGDTLRKHLMDRYDIQINKTSRNTLLFMLNIGTTRGAVAYLLEVMTQIARELEEREEDDSNLAKALDREKVKTLTERLPPLPNFSRFHDRFRKDKSSKTPEADLRAAFFLGRSDDSCDFLRLDGSVQRAMEDGRDVVAAGFVTPYPPGFPVLVPGQVLSEKILAYLKALDVKEIHGYNPEFGLRVFKQEVLGEENP